MIEEVVRYSQSETVFFLFQGLQDSAPLYAQPDKAGWIRKFSGKGIFREIWKNRFVVLRGDQLFVSEKEVSLEVGGGKVACHRLCRGHH